MQLGYLLGTIPFITSCWLFLDADLKASRLSPMTAQEQEKLGSILLLAGVMSRPVNRGSSFRKLQKVALREAFNLVQKQEKIRGVTTALRIDQERKDGQ